jgi:hypothetical protein
MIWRLSVLGSLIALAVWGAAQLVALGWWGLLVGGIIVTLVLAGFILFPTDLAGQVRVVATQPVALRHVLESVRSTVEAVQSRCDTVTLLGYSQGGYIAYESLRNWDLHPTSKTRTLIGVGSGLKPIRILTQLQESRTRLGTLVFACGGAIALFAVYLVAEQVRGPLALSGSVIDGGLIVFLLLPTPMLLHHLPVASGEPAKQLNDLQDLLWTGWLGDLPLFALVIVGFGIMLLGDRLRRKFTKNVKDIPDLTGVKWEEWSTPNDIVGRFSVPALSRKVRLRIAAGSHTVLDHLSTNYFGGGGVARAFLAERLISQASVPRPVKMRWREVVEHENRASLQAAARWYSLRGFVQLWLLAALVGLQWVTASSGIFEAFARTWWVYLIAGAFMAGIGWISVFLRSRRSNPTIVRQVVDRHARAPLSWVPAPPRDRNYWIRVVLLLLVSLTAWAVAVGMTLLTLSERAYTPGALAALAYAVLSAGYFCAVAADFRVPWWVSVVLWFLVFALSVILSVVASVAGFPAQAAAPGYETVRFLVVLQIVDAVLAVLRAKQRQKTRRQFLASEVLPRAKFVVST